MNECPAPPPVATRAVVGPDSYLTLHYRLADLGGTEHVSTFDLSPATLQMGSGQLAETLERCLLGLPAGERHVFQLAAADAFGEHNPRLVERIARGALPADVELKENSLIEFAAPNGGAGFAGLVAVRATRARRERVYGPGLLEVFIFRPGTLSAQ